MSLSNLKQPESIARLSSNNRPHRCSEMQVWPYSRLRSVIKRLKGLQLARSLNAKCALRVLVFGLLIPLINVACSGDGRAFKEAVETNELKLASITIAQPTGLLPDLYVNPGERVAFTVSGADKSGKLIGLSAAERRWSVDRSDVASIDDNGRFLAIADGQAVVRIQIGGLADTFTVNVDTDTLVSLNAIQGEDTLERCIPKEYSATGQFTRSTRGMPGLTWSVTDASLGSRTNLSNGRARVNGVNVGTMELVANAGAISTQKSIEIEDTLLEIGITPDNLAVQKGNTLRLGATGRYLKDGIERNGFAITNAVQWMLPDNNGVATVSNTPTGRGLISTIDVGNTQVSASCGNLQQSRALVVIARGTTSTSSLSFSGASPRVLSLSAGAQLLRVSTGTQYDVNNDVSTNNDTEWSVLTGSGVVAFSDTQAKNSLVPLSTGVATIRVTYNGASRDLDVRVDP